MPLGLFKVWADATQKMGFVWAGATQNDSGAEAQRFGLQASRSAAWPLEREQNAQSLTWARSSWVCRLGAFPVAQRMLKEGTSPYLDSLERKS